MKSIIYLFLSILSLQLLAQQPEKIYPNARSHKSVAYLKDQSMLWKREIEKDPKNVEAWYNYYYANRNIGFNDPSQTREQKQKTLTDLLMEMEKSIPETYEFNLIKWMHGGWNMKLVSYLEKAAKLGPDRPEHLDYSMVLAEMKGDKKARDIWAKRKFTAGEFSNGLLYYNYNVLVGLPTNAILITSGDNDTFPIWYLQSLGIRPDVTIVHTVLVNIDEYRRPVFASLGIDDWNKPAVTEPQNPANFAKPEDIVAYCATNKKNHPVYLGLTSTQCLKNTVLEHMYLTGLAYAHSKDPLDNIALLKKNFEKEYALDYLDKPFISEISPDLIKIVNGNYVVPMLKLLEHYKISGDQQKADWIKTKLLYIVKGTEDEQEVKKQIG